MTLKWRKSSYSNQESACVEIAPVGTGAAVRDSKTPEGGYFTVDLRQWAAFIGTVKSGRLDLS